MLKTAGKKFLSIVLALAVILGGVYVAPSFEADAASIDIGANPKPPVDIAVSVPADYPGTFLDFKEELTQKLLAQGMPAGSFRITDTATKIDTTDLSGWQVYDHYRDQGMYYSIVPADQRAAQPYRGADNSHTNGTGTIESYFKNNTNTTGNTCKNFDRHIYSSTDSEGKASMVFAGYGTTALSDFMIYPAASDSRRTFSFDINPAVIDTHTLGSYGFFLNAGIKNHVLNGYALIFSNSHVGSIQKITNLNVTTGNNTAQTISGSTIQSNISMGISSGQVARLTVELNKNNVTIQCQNYDSNGNLGAPRDLVKNLHLDDTGYNGFGPLVNYSGHGCSSLSIMKYSDLEMSYDSSAFDALKTTQYYEGAEQKYFINLAGDSADPQIPDATDPSFKDGINRMNENEIFYISNADDGKILKDPTDKTVGLGSENGYIANGDNYTELIAQYIYNNYIEGAKFKKNKIDSDLPLANFYLTNADTDEQLMTVQSQSLYSFETSVVTKELNRCSSLPTSL